jgi:hypothetical protein
MPQVTLTKIHKDVGGRIRFRFGKREYEFSSIEHAKEWVRSRFNTEDMDAIAIALCLERQPALGNLATLEGRTLTVNLSLANWGTVS